MKKFALTGKHIEHSKSPHLFAVAYQSIEKYSYGLLPAATAADSIRMFHEHKLSGMNVTAPFKNDILCYVDEQDEEVRRIGAANVILLQEGKLIAHNTDVAGVSGSFIEHGVKLHGATALVLGAGGAGQAAVYALKQSGANTFWYNRTMYKVEQLAASYGAIPLPFRALSNQLQKIKLIVNTLPPDADFLHTLPLHSSHIILDADYANKPLERQAIVSGAYYIDGLSWLLGQAIPSFFYFTGMMPDIEAMKNYLYPH